MADGWSRRDTFPPVTKVEVRLFLLTRWTQTALLPIDTTHPEGLLRQLPVDNLDLLLLHTMVTPSAVLSVGQAVPGDLVQPHEVLEVRPLPDGSVEAAWWSPHAGVRSASRPSQDLANRQYSHTAEIGIWWPAFSQNEQPHLA